MSIKRSGSTGRASTRNRTLQDQGQDKQVGNIAVTEEIDGEEVATHRRDYLAQRIVVAVE